MDILIERNGVRTYKDVHPTATAIPYVHRIRWVGSATMDQVYALVHAPTGRAINTVPLSKKSIEELLSALLECDVDWAEINPRKIADRLTDEALLMCGGTHEPQNP